MPRTWERTALWGALICATITLGIRLVRGSETPEAVATAMLAGVIVFALAVLAHRD